MPEVKHVEYHEDPVDGTIHEVSTVRQERPAIVQRTETTITPAISPAEFLRRRRYTLARVTQIVWLITGIIEALIGIRFVLKMIAANPQAGFAQFIYGMSAPFLVPFTNLTANPAVGGAVMEISSLIAMLIYALLAWGIVKIVWILFYKPTNPAIPYP